LLEIIEFATNYKELLEKIKIWIENNSLVIVKKTPSRFEKLWNLRPDSNGLGSQVNKAYDE
jgi:hypothetical protein